MGLGAQDLGLRAQGLGLRAEEDGLRGLNLVFQPQAPSPGLFSSANLESEIYPGTDPTVVDRASVKSDREVIYLNRSNGNFVIELHINPST